MLYIEDQYWGFDSNVGVRKKIRAQICAFRKTFDRVFLAYYQNQKVYLNDGEKNLEEEFAVSRVAYYEILFRWLKKYRIEKTYIRKPLLNDSVMQFLKRQKEQGIKTVVEIPTYPYDEEIKDEYALLEDQYFREKLHNFVDRISTYSEDEVIWGIPCIPLINGIDPESVSVKRFSQKKEKKITMIAVAYMADWQGYERVLQGMFDYYQNGGSYEFHLKLVGDGPKINTYKNLMEEYQLNSSVSFLGLLQGEELNRQYDLSDIALSSMGLYKVGFMKRSPIKTAEYCARGIPFVVGYQDLGFTGKEPFLLEVPNCAEPIDMNQIENFYDTVVSKQEVQNQMREYAKKNLTWEQIMKPVVEYFSNAANL